MKRKLCIAILSALLTSSVILTGCSSDGASDDTSKTKQEETSKEEENTSNPEDAKTEDTNLQDEKAEAENKENVSAENEKAENTVKATPKKKEKKLIMYTTVNLILRKKASMDAKKLEILPINTKVTVLKKGKEWYKVKAKKKTGYVYAEYLTKDQNVAKEAAALAAEEEARAAAEAAATAEAAAAAQYTAPQTNTDTGSAKTEVSREDYPDCDGSGHGYSEIHYSDGTTEIVEY